MARSNRAFFTHKESLRCQVLRQVARQNALRRESLPTPTERFESLPGEPKSIARQSAQPASEPESKLSPATRPPKIKPSWRYTSGKWRNHPSVQRFEDEPFIFINAEAYPTDPDAAVPLIAWLRQPAKLSSPCKNPIHSGVIKIEGVGWVVTLGHMPGAMDRMMLLLERKAGQILMFKGKRYSIAMDTYLPLEWMP